MPKVNTRFFECPECHNKMFKKKEYTIFVHNDEAPNVPELVYETRIEYVCTRCSRVVKKETVDG